MGSSPSHALNRTEEEDGGDDGEYLPRPLRSNHALDEAQQPFHDGLDEPLQPSRDELQLGRPKHEHRQQRAGSDEAGENGVRQEQLRAPVEGVASVFAGDLLRRQVHPRRGEQGLRAKEGGAYGSGHKPRQTQRQDSQARQYEEPLRHQPRAPALLLSTVLSVQGLV